MTAAPTFRYFPDYRRWAKTSPEPCTGCASGFCLDGVYFGNEAAPEAVCLDDLVAGKVSVGVPGFIRDTLEQSVRTFFPSLSEAEIQARVRESVLELERTPPVPWIQSNMWPVADGDFCRYVGEWNQELLAAEAPDGDGKVYLMSILQDASEIDDPDELWASIAAEWSAVFVFESLRDGRRIAVEQSY